MPPVRRIFAASLLATTAFLAAACTPAGSTPAPPPAGQTSQPAPPAEGQTSPTPDGGSGGGGGACPSVPQEGFELFSSPAVLEAPAEGQVFGGPEHPIVWTFAEAQEYSPSVDLSYVNSAGDAIPMTAFPLEDLGGNQWGSSFEVFTSGAADRPGFAVLHVSGSSPEDDEIAGVYCLTFKVTE